MALSEINKNSLPVPRHIAIIMDGNGRWAKKRALPREAGHKVGVSVFEKVALHCFSKRKRDFLNQDAW